MNDMQAQGAKNDDIESLQVGWGCECQLWASSLGGAGWRETFAAGDYNATAIEATSAELNDASAMIVTQVAYETVPNLLQATVEVTAELQDSRLFLG